MSPSSRARHRPPAASTAGRASIVRECASRQRQIADVARVDLARAGCSDRFVWSRDKSANRSLTGRLDPRSVSTDWANAAETSASRQQQEVEQKMHQRFFIRSSASFKYWLNFQVLPTSFEGYPAPRQVLAFGAGVPSHRRPNRFRSLPADVAEERLHSMDGCCHTFSHALAARTHRSRKMDYARGANLTRLAI